MSRHVIVLGATSSIGGAVAQALASRGDRLVITGRDADVLERTAADLELRFGGKVHPLVFDAVELESHRAWFEEGIERLAGQLDGVVLAYGLMVEQEQANRCLDLARKMVAVNYTSAISILGIVADHLRERKRGFICALSSVAADRGRARNYLYGATKAALNTYLEGLRQELHRLGVRVLTVKPGFVDTPMTWGRIEPSRLVASRERVARDIVRAIDRGRNEIYTPWFWYWIMAAIRSIPEGIYKRLDF